MEKINPVENIGGLYDEFSFIIKLYHHGCHILVTFPY
jgi:hypothetical protein